MIKEIKCFHSLVENESYLEAAKEMYLSVAELEKIINALEDDLGVELVKRSGGYPVLTVEGKAFYSHSYDLLRREEEMACLLQHYKGRRGHTLRIGMLYDLRMLQFEETVSEFTGKHTYVHVEVVHGTNDELYDLLYDGNLDIVIGYQISSFMEDFLSIKIDAREFYVELPSDNPFAEGKSIEIRDLDVSPLILLPSVMDYVRLRSYEDTGPIDYKRDFHTIDIEEFIRRAEMNRLDDFRLPPLPGNDDTSLSHLKSLKLTHNGRPVAQRIYAYFNDNDRCKHTYEFISELIRKFR